MNQTKSIPFNKPYVATNAMKYVEEALKSNHHQGGGPFNQKAAELIRRINGNGEVFLTSSCTQALEMATILLDLKPGDEVIMPSYTFTSAATALINFGVIPIFVDVEPNHLNIDPNRVRNAITSKTKAISVVNYAGFACDYIALDEIAEEFSLLKIEDNAHGFGIVSNSYKLGTWGDVATLSFHATKNIQCGEGGALIVNNPKYIERAYILQEKGTNRRKYLQGHTEKYEWKDKGGSYLLSELNAAFLLSQLEEFDEIQNMRKKTVDKYIDAISNEILDYFFDILNLDVIRESSFHMFAILLRNNSRKSLITHLEKNRIIGSFHYQSLHRSLAGAKFARLCGNFDNSNRASDNLLRLPLWIGLKEEDIEKIVISLRNFEHLNLEH